MEGHDGQDTFREGELISNGVSVKVFQAEPPDMIVVRYTDGISAFNGIKRASIEGKGRLNAEIAAMVAEYLERNGIRSRFVKRLDDVSLLCRKTEPIELEIIVRNVIAGSMAHRLGVEEGFRPENTIFDLCYKNAELGDPLVNDHYAVALGLASYDELKKIYDYAARINGFLKSLMESIGIDLVDFKLEFGRDAGGSIVLADELTPDNARFWDIESREKLDRDRYRRDMGKVGEAYRTICGRLESILCDSHKEE